MTSAIAPAGTEIEKLSEIVLLKVMVESRVNDWLVTAPKVTALVAYILGKPNYTSMVEGLEKFTP